MDKVDTKDANSKVYFELGYTKIFAKAVVSLQLATSKCKHWFLFFICHMLRSEFFLHQAVTLMTPSSLLFVELYQNLNISKHWSEDILSNLQLIPPIYLLPNDGHSILQEWW